jgi:hypothetical protein
MSAVEKPKSLKDKDSLGSFGLHDSGTTAVSVDALPRTVASVRMSDRWGGSRSADQRM